MCLNVCVSCHSESPSSLSNILEEYLPKLNLCNYFTDELGKETLENDPIILDFLCIDVDGTDYWLMKDVLELNNRHLLELHVICCEFNPTIPNDCIYIQEQNDNVRHGSSLAAFTELAVNNNIPKANSAFFISIRRSVYLFRY